MPVAFLTQQIELREALDDAVSIEDLDEINVQAKKILLKQLSEVEQMIDTLKDYKLAAQAVRALMFVERFTQDIGARYEALGQ